MTISTPAGSDRGTSPAGGPLALALAAAATATTLVALWLAFTVFTVLPSRDPGHIPMWCAVAAGLLVFALSSFAAVFPGPLRPGAGVVAGILGVAAAGLGLGSAIRMLSGGGAGGHFEGYIVLMGIVVGAHGLLALANAVARPRSTRT